MFNAATKEHNMTANQAALAEFQANALRAHGQQKLEDAVRAFQRAADEMRAYAERYAAATTDEQRAQVLNWAIHHAVQSPASNARVDLLATAQARLTAQAARAA